MLGGGERARKGRRNALDSRETSGRCTVSVNGSTSTPLRRYHPRGTCLSKHTVPVVYGVKRSGLFIFFFFLLDKTFLAIRDKRTTNVPPGGVTARNQSKTKSQLILYFVQSRCGQRSDKYYIHPVRYYKRSATQVARTHNSRTLLLFV